MKVENLKIGQGYKFKGQRVFRTCSGIRILGHGDNIHPAHRGQVLINFNGCHQVIHPKGTEVITNT